MKYLYLQLLLVFVALTASAQQKLNYGLVLGADRLKGVNDYTQENLIFQSRTIPKIGFFVEKPMNEKLAYSAMLTFHYFYEGFSEKIVGFGFDDLPPLVYEDGLYKYYDLNVGAKYNVS